MMILPILYSELCEKCYIYFSKARVLTKKVSKHVLIGSLQYKFNYLTKPHFKRRTFHVPNLNPYLVRPQ